MTAGVAAELESQQDQQIRLTQWETQNQENTQAWDRFLAARPMECMDRESFYTSPVGAPHRKELSFLRSGGDLRPGLSAYEKHCQLSTFKPPFPDLAKDPPITDTSSSEQIEFKVRVICLQATKREAKKYPMNGAFGGEGGIRTRGGLLTLTRFPGVRLKPLIHLSGSVKL